MSAPREQGREFARVARALASSLRRAEWRGQQRVEFELASPEHQSRPDESAIGTRVAPKGKNQPPRAQEGDLKGAEQPSSAALTGTDAGTTTGNPVALENRSKAAACADLDALRQLVAGCQACPLHATRTQTVFQDGSQKARVLFVGEAPGADEDAQGVPFVGPSGRLLSDIIEKGMGLARAEVAIANVLKCRPPGNRDPEPSEKESCTPFLDRQIELIDPELIIPLGRHASQHLLNSKLSMGRLRGRVHLLGTRKVVPTYHPSYLLRTPSAKKDCWQDIQMAMAQLGLTPPSKS